MNTDVDPGTLTGYTQTNIAIHYEPNVQIIGPTSHTGDTGVIRGYDDDDDDDEKIFARLKRLELGQPQARPVQASKEAETTTIKKEGECNVVHKQPDAKKQNQYVPVINNSKINESTKTNDDTQQCCICLDNRKNVLAQPCSHLCLCMKCVALNHDPTRSSIQSCPLCQAVVTSWIVVASV